MKKALIVGINNTINAPLQYAINDAYAWRSLLQARGFQCTMLLNSQATNTLYRSALNTLFNGVKPGDKLVWAHSEHGTRKIDTSGDESDGYDEVICPQNFSAVQYIDDDYIRGLIASRLPEGVTFDIFADCCYAGTNTRDSIISNITPRYIPPPKGLVRIGKGKRDYVSTGMKEILWAACKDNQTSWEGRVGNTGYGLFGYFTRKAIQENMGSRADIIASVTESLAALGLNQTPQLECKPEAALVPPFM